MSDDEDEDRDEASEALGVSGLDEEEEEGSDYGEDEAGVSPPSSGATTPVDASLLPCVWERMANNIDPVLLRDEATIRRFLAGMNKEVSSVMPRMHLWPDRPRPDWKALAKGLLRARGVEESDQGFEARWGKAQRAHGLVHGCEVLIHLSKESNLRAHEDLCRAAIWDGDASTGDGPMHTRITLSEFDLARYTMLTCGDDVAVIGQDNGLSSFMYWDGGRWCEQLAAKPNRFSCDTYAMHHGLLQKVAQYHHRRWEDAKSQELGKTVIDKAAKRYRAAQKSHDCHGSRAHAQVRVTMFDRMSALSTTEDPFDGEKRILPFTNGVIDLKTKAFRPVDRHDFVLRTTGYPWVEPTVAQVAKLREVFESILPDEGPRKTLYCLLRCCLSAEAFEKFWMLIGEGRNGKGWVMKLLDSTLGKAFSQPLMSTALLTQVQSGMGATPEIFKMHRARVANWSEPPEGKGGGGGGLKLQLSEVKRLTGEAKVPGRNCNSNDSDVDNWSTKVLQCNSAPRITGTIDESAVQRFVMIPFPFTFTDDKTKLEAEPSKYKPLDDSLKSDTFIQSHRCALVKLLMDECEYGELHVAPECKELSMKYLNSQDPVLAFLDECCERPADGDDPKHFLTLKDLHAAYNEVNPSAKLQLKDIKAVLAKSQTHAPDLCEQNQALLTKVPRKVRNTQCGLLHWRLITDEDGHGGGGGGGSGGSGSGGGSGGSGSGGGGTPRQNRRQRVV